MALRKKGLVFQNKNGTINLRKATNFINKNYYTLLPPSKHSNPPSKRRIQLMSTSHQTLLSNASSFNFVLRIVVMFFHTLNKQIIYMQTLFVYCSSKVSNWSCKFLRISLFATLFLDLLIIKNKDKVKFTLM